MTGKWEGMTTAPLDGTFIDVRFDPATAEVDQMGSMAEFYAPGCTRRRHPTEPIIERVHFQNRHFRPEGLHGIISVTLTGWRPRTPTP